MHTTFTCMYYNILQLPKWAQKTLHHNAVHLTFHFLFDKCIRVWFFFNHHLIRHQKVTFLHILALILLKERLFLTLREVLARMPSGISRRCWNKNVYCCTMHTVLKTAGSTQYILHSMLVLHSEYSLFHAISSYVIFLPFEPSSNWFVWIMMDVQWCSAVFLKDVFLFSHALFVSLHCDGDMQIFSSQRGTFKKRNGPILLRWKISFMWPFLHCTKF